MPEHEIPVEWLERIKDVHLTFIQAREHIFKMGLMSTPGTNRSMMITERELASANIMMVDALRAGRAFDFGHLDNEEMQETAIRIGPLYNQGAFGHPFNKPWVYYHTWNAHAYAKAHGMKHTDAHTESTSLYLVNPLGDGKPPQDCEVLNIEPMQMDGMILFMVGDRGLLQPRHDDTGYTCQLVPAAFAYTSPENIPELERMLGHSVQGAAAGNLFDPLMTVLSILNTRGVRQTKMEANAKLQRARQRVGKPPIPPHYVIDSESYLTALRSGKRSEPRVDPTHTHASPRPHLRRGHWRNYSDGERTFIRDTLVNVSDEARDNFIAARTHYRMMEDKNQ